MNIQELRDAHVIDVKIQKLDKDIKFINLMLKDLMNRPAKHELRNSIGIFTEKARDPSSPKPKSIQERYREEASNGKMISIEDVIKMNEERLEAEMPLFKYEEYMDEEEVTEVLLFIVKSKKAKKREFKSNLKSIGIKDGEPQKTKK